MFNPFNCFQNLNRGYIAEALKSDRTTDVRATGHDPDGLGQGT